MTIARMFSGALLALAAQSPAYAQELMADPTFATLNLDAGFRPDPQSVEVVSGGEGRANSLGTNCVGFIANVPDVRINYRSGNYPLIFSVLSDADTTLVINGPDGRWYCDDDGSGDLDPVFNFSGPMSGQYDVFIGSYDYEYAEATLLVSEIE